MGGNTVALVTLAAGRSRVLLTLRLGLDKTTLEGAHRPHLVRVRVKGEGEGEGEG